MFDHLKNLPPLEPLTPEEKKALDERWEREKYNSHLSRKHWDRKPPKEDHPF